MRSLLAALGLLFAALAADSAQAQFTPVGVGPIQSGSSGYVGPGDIVTTGWAAYYSATTAFNAAYATAGGAAFTVQRTSDSATCTASFQASGLLNPTPCSGSISVAAFCASTTCNFTNFKDQSQSSACGGGSCDMPNPSGSFGSVQLSAACLSSFDCIYNGSNYLSFIGTANPVSFSNPLTIIGISKCTTNCTSSTQGLLTDYSNAIGFARSDDGAGNMTYDLNLSGVGTFVQSATTTANAWHYVAGAVNSGATACQMYVDGSSSGSAASCGAVGFENFLLIGGNGTGTGTGDYALELGINTTELSSGQIASLHANAVTRLGIP